MKKYLDLEGLRKFKEQADAAYLPVKGTIPLTGSINLTTESVASLGLKYAKVANNSLNFYVIADSSDKLPSSETRININSSITSLVGAEGANVGDIFVVGKLDLKPVYKIIPLNDAKAENSTYRGTQGVVTPWDKAQINKVPNMEAAINAAKNNLPTYSEGNMNNALQTGVYPWCTLGRPDGSTGAYTLLTLASTTQDNAGYTTIEQTAYGRQGNELGKIFKRIIFKKDTEVQFGDWLYMTGGSTINKAIKTYAIKGGNITIRPTETSTNLRFNIPDDMFESGILDIRAVIPCVIRPQGDHSIPNKEYYFPLSALGYKINYAEKIATGGAGDPVIDIAINKSIVYNNKVCDVILRGSYPNNFTGFAAFYIEIDYIPKYSATFAPI